MNQIETLLKKREELKASHNETENELQQTIQNEADKIFDECPILKQAVADAESSSDYGNGEYGEVYRWTRFDVPEQYDSLRDELDVWFRDNHCLIIDFQHDALLSYEGDCIIVNHEGDVFLNHDVIIDSKQCTDDEGEYSVSERNKLIEEYMEKSGYFPTVLSQDYHGNLYHINTLERG